MGMWYLPPSQPGQERVPLDGVVACQRPFESINDTLFVATRVYMLER